MSSIGNMATDRPRAIIANIRDHTDDPRQVDDELADDALQLVGGGLYRREVYVDVCYDDDGQVVDVTYIDIGW
jgi:hypothetical protein